MLVYDVGMHNGDDTEYYLKKGCDVVAIEANPSLCEEASARFSEFLTSGRLRLLNVGISDAEGTFPFYIDKGNSVRSSFSPLGHENVETVQIETKRLSDLIREFGLPEFLKIDIEHFDAAALSDLRANGIKPAMISAEAHSFEVALRLWALEYKEFRLVNGSKVHREFRQAKIRRQDGTPAVHSFPRHSSGPFGDDLPGPWFNIEQICAQWLLRHALFGSGWFDIHAR